MLDTTWTTPNDMKTGRSISFGPMLTTLLQQLEFRIAQDGTYTSVDEYLQITRDKSFTLLEQLFEAMQLQDMWEYIIEFVNEFPPGN